MLFNSLPYMSQFHGDHHAPTPTENTATTKQMRLQANPDTKYGSTQSVKPLISDAYQANQPTSTTIPRWNHQYHTSYNALHFMQVVPYPYSTTSQQQTTFHTSKNKDSFPVTNSHQNNANRTSLKRVLRSGGVAAATHGVHVQRMSDTDLADLRSVAQFALVGQAKRR